MLAEASCSEMVLSVNIHRERAAECYVHRARHNGWPPAGRQAALPELLDGDARLNRNDTRFWVPLKNQTQIAKVEDDLLGVDRGIAVTSTSSTQANRSLFGASEVE